MEEMITEKGTGGKRRGGRGGKGEMGGRGGI